MTSTKIKIYFSIIFLLAILIAFVPFRVGEKDDEKEVKKPTFFVEERILKLNREMELPAAVKPESTGSIALRLDQKLHTERKGKLDLPANIEQLYQEYMTFLSEETASTGFQSAKSWKYGNRYFINQVQDSGEKLSLGNDFYISDRLEYAYNKNWLFELEVNNVLFWIEADEDGKKSFIPNQEESSIATFSIKYSF